MENSPLATCPICNASAKKRRQDTFLCTSCMLLFKTKKVKQNYDSHYFKHYYAAREQKQLLRFTQLATVLSTYVSFPASLIDYGCGRGVFLQAARTVGFSNNVGADVSAAALQEARQYVGKNDTLVHLEHESIPKSSYQAIVLMDSITAVENPFTFLSNFCNQYLASDGILLIRTPDISRVYLLIAKVVSSLVPSLSEQIYFPRRQYSFGKRSMRALLEKSGFEILHMSNESRISLPVTWNASSIKNCIVNVLSPPMIVIARKARTHA